MLNVDIFFYKALSQSAEVAGVVSDRIYNPARTIEQEKADVVPYIILTYDGGQSTQGDKDTLLAPLDTATVSVLCVAESRDQLANLVDLVETAVGEAFDDDDFGDDDFYEDSWEFYINDADQTASAVMFDPLKPCCYQTLTFRCSTTIR